MVSTVSSHQALKPTVVSALAEQAFREYPAAARSTLLDIRQLIIRVHQQDEDLGELQEVLRWNQLSYLTVNPVTGSMIRLATTKPGKAALFFHCGTTLVESFRTQYSHVFEFEKNRALIPVLPVSDTQQELTACIRQALRYKLKS